MPTQIIRGKTDWLPTFDYGFDYFRSEQRETDQTPYISFADFLTGGDFGNGNRLTRTQAIEPAACASNHFQKRRIRFALRL